MSGMAACCTVRRVVLAALAAIALIASVAPTGAETVAWYRFEEGVGKEFAKGIGSVLDTSRHHLNGTPASDHGTPYAHALAPFGDVALALNGRDNWVFVPDCPRLELAKSLTLEAFVKVRGFNHNGVANFIIFRGDDRPGLDAYWLSLDPRACTLNFGVQGSHRDGGVPTAILKVPFTTLDRTLHVAGVLDDKTGFMGLYIDGEVVDSMTTSVRACARLHPLYQPGLGIGGFFAGHPPGSFCLDGIIDEVRISNVALKPQQFLYSYEEP